MITPITLEIPKDLQSITVEQLVKLSKVEAKKLKPIDELYEILDIFFGLSKEAASNIPMKQLKGLHAKLKAALTKETEFRKSFELNGVTYAMIPDLDDCELGEYTDMDKYITPASVGEVNVEMASRFLTVLFRPLKSGDVNNLYDIESYEGTSKHKLMMQAPADVYVNSVGFFLTLRLQLSEILISYLRTEAMKKAKEAPNETNITELGDGLDQLITLHREIYSNGMQSLNSKLKMCLPSWHLIKKGQKLQGLKDSIGKLETT